MKILKFLAFSLCIVCMFLLTGCAKSSVKFTLLGFEFVTKDHPKTLNEPVFEIPAEPENNED